MYGCHTHTHDAILDNLIISYIFSLLALTNNLKCIDLLRTCLSQTTIIQSTYFLKPYTLPYFQNSADAMINCMVHKNLFLHKTTKDEIKGDKGHMRIYMEKPRSREEL